LRSSGLVLNSLFQTNASFSFLNRDDVLLPTTNQVQSRYGGYILKNITAADSGVYSCSATNTIAGVEVKMPQRYSIIVTPTPRSAPTFHFEPSTTFSAKPGESVLLECPGISNPIPKATWSRPDKNLDLNSNRINVLSYGLQINNVQLEDEGTYICRLDNGENPVKVHTMRFNVLQMPIILEPPQPSLTNESDRLELNCRISGSPPPEIYWMINGEETKYDSLISQEGSKLIISSVEKKHAGIVQCFAKNEVGETSEGALLQVNPKQINGEGKPFPLGGVPHKSRPRPNGRVHNDKKRNRGREYPLQ
jgi:brother of ihog